MRLVVTQPRDIALAIRISPPIDSATYARAATEAEMEDAFQELGMEVVDELAKTEEDDERRQSFFALFRSAGEITC